jgi:hypothetical protein
MVSTRRGSISYNKVLENIPSKIDKHFSAYSKIVVFPQQNYLEEDLGEYSSASLSAVIETVQKIGKGIGSIFKKDDPEG